MSGGHTWAVYMPNWKKRRDFITSSTQTHDLEENFITRKLGSQAKSPPCFPEAPYIAPKASPVTWRYSFLKENFSSQHSGVSSGGRESV